MQTFHNEKLLTGRKLIHGRSMSGGDDLPVRESGNFGSSSLTSIREVKCLSYITIRADLSYVRVRIDNELEGCASKQRRGASIMKQLMLSDSVIRNKHN